MAVIRAMPPLKTVSNTCSAAATTFSLVALRRHHATPRLAAAIIERRTPMLLEFSISASFSDRRIFPVPDLYVPGSGETRAEISLRRDQARLNENLGFNSGSPVSQSSVIVLCVVRMRDLCL